MKRVGAIILAFTYLLLTIGISLDVHVCHSSKSVTLIGLMDSDCACSSAAESACSSEYTQNSCCSVEQQPVSCCYDEELNLKYEEKNQILSPSTKLTAPQELLLLKETIEVEEAMMSMEPTPFEEERPPPKVPLYLSNSNFTFYG